ncbi:hypothetical protein Dimus_011369, partial [Dionaea muscipula]
MDGIGKSLTGDDTQIESEDMNEDNLSILPNIQRSASSVMEQIRVRVNSGLKDHDAMVTSMQRPVRDDDVDTGLNDRVDTIGGAFSASYNNEDCLGSSGLRSFGENPKQRGDRGMEGFEVIPTLELSVEAACENLGRGKTGGRQSQSVSLVGNSFSLEENGEEVLNRKRMVDEVIINGECGGSLNGALIETKGLIPNFNLSNPGSNSGDLCENLGQSGLLGVWVIQTNEQAKEKREIHGRRSKYNSGCYITVYKEAFGEAEICWKIGKLLDDDEVVSRLKELEDREVVEGGLVSLEKRRKIKKLIRERKPDMVLLQETNVR